MTRVPVQPEMLRWACERAGYDVHDLMPRFPHRPEWERGEKLPTFKQLEAFAKATHTPFGFLFLPEPPGRLSFKEAYDLTGLHGGTFQEYARHLGINAPEPSAHTAEELLC